MLRLLAALTLALTACATTIAEEPQPLVTSLQAEPGINTCHVAATALDDGHVTFTATNCQPGEIALLTVLASWGVVMDAGVIGGGSEAVWFPRPGTFTAIETATERIIATITRE